MIFSSYHEIHFKEFGYKNNPKSELIIIFSRNSIYVFLVLVSDFLRMTALSSSIESSVCP